MENKNPRSVLLFAFFSLFTLFLSDFAKAANISTNGQPTRGQSMQAFTAIADDPSAIFYNPAGITQLTGTHIDSSVLYAIPDLKYTNSLNNVSTHSTLKSPGGNLFITTDKLTLLRPFVFGFGIFAPFARRPHYERNAAVYNLPQDGDILRLDFVPSVAVKLGQYVSIGGGLVLSEINAKSNILGLKERAEGYGVTGQAGIMFYLPQDVRIGVTYRGRETAHLQGRGKLPGLSSHFTLNLRFPDVLSFGASWHVFKPLILTAVMDYEFWGFMQSIRRHYKNPAFNPVSVNPVQGRNSPIYRVGTLYRMNEHHEFRGGFSYDPEAIPSKNIVPAKPDYDAYIFSVGYSYYYKQWRSDIGYEYEYMPKHHSSSPVFPGSYKMHVQIVMLGIGYTFA